MSDDERCTALGQKVLKDRGSSVDAAVAAALCLGVVQPHVSGIGGYVCDWWLIGSLWDLHDGDNVHCSVEAE